MLLDYFCRRHGFNGLKQSSFFTFEILYILNSIVNDVLLCLILLCFALSFLLSSILASFSVFQLCLKIPSGYPL